MVKLEIIEQTIRILFEFLVKRGKQLKSYLVNSAANSLSMLIRHSWLEQKTPENCIEQIYLDFLDVNYPLNKLTFIERSSLPLHWNENF